MVLADVPTGILEATSGKGIVGLFRELRVGGEAVVRIPTTANRGYACRGRIIMTSHTLRQIATVEVSACERFVAAEHFKEHVGGESLREHESVICEFGGYFEKYFLGKIEENIPATTLTLHVHSKKAMTDAGIVKELGERAETKLAQVYELLSRQLIGGAWGSTPSPLYHESRAKNAFYIRGTDGDLWVVTVAFRHHTIYGDGPDAMEGHPADQWWAWNVSADPITSGWAPHQRVVFSH